MNEKIIPADLYNKFEVFNYKHAAEIISQAFPAEWNDILTCLRSFKISEQDLAEAGGAETNIPGKIDEVLYYKKWRNIRITGDLHIKFYERIIDQKQYEEFPSHETIASNFVSGHHVDYLKGRVAMCLEWNKKDISFDRVLSAFKAFYDCDIISVGIILTRSSDLNEVFKEIHDSEGKPIMRKYGSSSTWMGKLIPRIESRQAGGCPILALGIKRECVEGFE